MATKNEVTKTAASREHIHHVGADIPIRLYRKLQAAAKKDGVPYSVVIRWALSDFLVGQEGSEAPADQD